MQRALAADGARECAVVVGREQHAAVDRNGGGNDRRQVGRVADRGHGLAVCLGANRLGPRLQPVDRRLDELVERFRADDRIEPAVEGAGDVLGPFLRVGIPELVGRTGQVPAVGDQMAVGREQPQAASGRLGDGREDRLAVLGAGGEDRLGGRGGLDPRLADAFLAQAIAEYVEIERAERDQQHGEHIEREDPLAERPAPRPAQPKIGFLTVRRIDIRRHRGSRWHRIRGRRRGTCGGSA